MNNKILISKVKIKRLQILLINKKNKKANKKLNIINK